MFTPLNTEKLNQFSSLAFHVTDKPGGSQLQKPGYPALVAVFHQALVLVIIKCNIIQLLASAWLLVNCCK